MGPGCVRSQPEDPARTSQAEPPEPVAPQSVVAVTLVPRTRGWDPGRRYSYRLTMTSAVSFGDAASAFDFDIVGHAVFIPITTTGEVAALYATLADSQITSRTPGSQQAFDKIAHEIRGAGCFVEIVGGKVAKMRLPRGLSPVAANTFRAVAAALQFAAPSGDASRYTSEEYDSTGQYVAEYERDADGSWHKRKQRYLGLLTAKNAAPNTPAKVVPDVVASEGTVRLSADGRPEHVDMRDEVDIKGAQTPIHSTTVLSLASDPPETAPQAKDWQALVDQTDVLEADEPYGAPASVAALDEARINGTTFAKVLAQLEQFAKDRTRMAVGGAVNGQPLDADERTRREKVVQEDLNLFEALTAIFRQRPETVMLAVQKIRAKSPASPVLLDALGSASTPATQRALIELAQAKTVDAETRSRAATALAGSSNPDAQSIAALKAMLVDEPFKGKALFGLGTYSRRLRDAGQADLARDIGEFLVDRLRQAKSAAAQVMVLRAIANSGYEGALPLVVPYLSNDDEQVKVAAVRALQSMHDPKVDEILASVLNEDALSSVRLAALESSAVRQPNEPFAHALAGVAANEPDAHVRYRAVELMIQWMSARPQLRTTLEQIATSDEEGQVRERAKAAL
jgi:hypothetical protein